MGAGSEHTRRPIRVHHGQLLHHGQIHQTLATRAGLHATGAHSTTAVLAGTCQLPTNRGSQHNWGVGWDLLCGTDAGAQGAEYAPPHAPDQEEAGILLLRHTGGSALRQQGSDASASRRDEMQLGFALDHQLATRLILRGDVDGHHAVHADGCTLGQLRLPGDLHLGELDCATCRECANDGTGGDWDHQVGRTRWLGLGSPTDAGATCGPDKPIEQQPLAWGATRSTQGGPLEMRVPRTRNQLLKLRLGR